MAREDKVQQWLDIAERDIDAAEWMHKGGRWLYVAFECHQAIEKLIKAYWTGTCDDEPLYIHDHWRLLKGCGLADKLSIEQRNFIERMKPMYIASRYPQYKNQVAASLNESVSANILEETQQFKQWILQEYSAATKHSISSDATNG
ncbi:MAG: HEPN domain-containing protein [Bacteroidaceae bacterium]|nr:HEPN domain-containing protein [Bacteroidaceae bacterium]